MLHAGRRSLTIRSFIAERSCLASSSRSPLLLASTSSETACSSSAAVATHRQLSKTAFARHASTSAKGKNASPNFGSSSSPNDKQVKDATEIVDYGAKLREQKLEDMYHCLADRNTSPNRVWARYVELLDITKESGIPLDLHQRVLRQCTPSFQAIRTSFARSLPKPLMDTRPHPHEHRFLTVFNTIKQSGQHASSDDYEFVLEQFAAVGHHIGCARVLREIVIRGLDPRTKAYGLCLQAIAYRLSLPQRGTDLEIERFKSECARLCLYVMNTIQKRAAQRHESAKGKQKMEIAEDGETTERRGVPSVCADLTLRIMKDTDDADTFLSLLKATYGIDLDYLDRHPLPSEGMLKQPENLSTAALTTIVDFFGRTSQLTKMVATFEALKAPLTVPPPSAKTENENEFSEDDDDDYVIPMNTLATPLPSASPNITTYNTLIRHCVAQKHRDFARHYALEALDRDRISSEKLKSQVEALFPHSERSALPMELVELNFEGLQAGDVRVNVDTFRPLVGLANKDKDYVLMKWVLMRMREVLRWKAAERSLFERLFGTGIDFPSFDKASTPGGDEDHLQISSAGTDGKAKWEDAHGLSNPSDFFTPSSSSSTVTPSLLSPASSSSTVPTASESTTRKTASNSFYPLQHLSLIRTQWKDLYDLSNHVGASLARIADRNKERLGRRVWEGKRVYMQHKGRRVLISREKWRERVHFGGRGTETDEKGSEEPKSQTD